MENYNNIIRTVLDKGVRKSNRTGIDARTIHGAMFTHKMSEGFPVITSRKLPFKTIQVELEGFIKGETDKRWYQENGCTIWDEWESPTGKGSHDLGPIYGYQWRNFNGEENETGDQLKFIVDTLTSDPNNRRLLCSAWNPHQIKDMALPPCHFAFHFVHINGELNLTWFQRSCDVMLGLPFNIASYGLLLTLVAKQTGLKPGTLTGMLSDVHIYENHIDTSKIICNRRTFQLPKIYITPDFTDIFSWNHNMTKLIDYQAYDNIKMDVAV